MYDFGSRLKVMRRKRGLTQKRLAEEIGKSVQAVSSYERNSQIPPIEVMISIADVLNVSLDFLVDRQPVNTFSFFQLSSKQRAILELLQDEFCSPSKDDSALSARQALIIQKLVLLFSSSVYTDLSSDY